METTLKNGQNGQKKNNMMMLRQYQKQTHIQAILFNRKSLI